jgi:N-acetylmuramoyl-L-alanine amidase
LNRVIALLLTVLLSGCSAVPTVHLSPLADWQPSVNHDTRRARMIILHHTEMASFEAALQTLKTANPFGRVSSHYLIAADGRIAQLVDEDARAWHAGLSRWRGLDDLNSSSIGIELDNDGRTPFTDLQIDALLKLLDDICSRRGLDRREVWAHADVAPTRKADPSKFFPWARLAKAGFGWWPRAEAFSAALETAPSTDPDLALTLLGYDLRQRDAAIRAYRRHFRGDELTTLDARDRHLLADLADQLIHR